MPGLAATALFHSSTVVLDKQCTRPGVRSTSFVSIQSLVRFLPILRVNGPSLLLLDVLVTDILPLSLFTRISSRFPDDEYSVVNSYALVVVIPDLGHQRVVAPMSQSQQVMSMCKAIERRRTG